MLRVSFDKKAGAIYIKISDNEVKKTIEFAPETFVDLDSTGKLVGVEMLRPGKLEIIGRIAKTYNAPMLKEMDPTCIPKFFTNRHSYA